MNRPSLVLLLAPTLVLTTPRPWQVVQREGFNPAEAHVHAIGGPQLGYADVAIRGTAAGFDARPRLEYRALPEPGSPEAFGPGCDWTKLEASGDPGAFRGRARIPAGGWYRLEVRGTAGNQAATATVQPFGVGEVLVVAGQSYASGSNAELLKVADPAERVVAYDTERHTWAVANDPQPHVNTGGTLWPELGNLLLPLLRVPIGFVNVAVGGTASREWLPGEKLYRNLARAGTEVGRFRAVLWQQGESDVVEKTPAATYVARLELIRASLARTWGFSPPWLPAKSTLHPFAYDNPAQEEVIRQAIAELWRQPGFFPGPDTDILGGENRASYAQGRHFTGLGQRRAALLWSARVWDLINR